MNGIGGWFRRFGANMAAGLRRFMHGRYGSDKLNNLLLGAGFVAVVISLFINIPAVNLLLTLFYYGMLCWAIFRMLSRNTYKRYQENRKYLMLLQRFKDKEHRYYDCPKCRQQIRVPKGKGKISITCPKCREKFIRKT